MLVGGQDLKVVDVVVLLVGLLVESSCLWSVCLLNSGGCWLLRGEIERERVNELITVTITIYNGWR